MEVEENAIIPSPRGTQTWGLVLLEVELIWLWKNSWVSVR
ncbi:hypothetical protein MiSe_09280 [Microseira wollei NIES-4236]|uniref:Uncharacterized protein n=1 Tax=Microseira wollei NIES-4236 TaxID=2530354 RepID=A0AAV3X6F6_9CYAN|nr:hypothetical protein MiSe_09280 [Microseira wollei NIES-4236]